MAFTLEDLLPGDQQPKTVQLHQAISAAIDTMCQHGYSQLPVTTADLQFLGQVVTFESIVQAIQSFQTKPQLLLVRDVAQSSRSYPADSDLLAMLDDLHRDNYALIVDGNKLRGIVTTADATAFFREYAEDLMRIEGIEAGVKDAIRTVYTGHDDQLISAIVRVSDRAAETRKKLPGAIKAYLGKSRLTVPVELAPEALAEAESKLGLVGPAAKLEDLSLNDLIEVLLQHDRAPRLAKSQDVSELRNLLLRVRDARNKLAHFRGELTNEERRTIRFAAKWLETNLPTPPPEESTFQTPIMVESVTPLDQERAEEEAQVPQGSYAPLASHLRFLPLETVSTMLTFQQIEDILKKELPRSALEYRAWWSNDPMKPQSAAWLEEGWRTTSVNMTDRRLTFVRTDDRERAYIRFFAKLNTALGTHHDFPLRRASPQGNNWLILASLDKSLPDSAMINASFARQKRLRVELYLDAGDKDQNKGRFDRLLGHKAEFEQTVGEPMDWERMDDRRASRIAVYRKAQILTDADSPELVDWAAKKAAALYRAFRSQFEQL